MKYYQFKTIYTGQSMIDHGVLGVQSGKIESVNTVAEVGEQSIDQTYKAQVALPGFIDIHNHGGYGIDFGVESAEKCYEVLTKFPKEGVTSIVATIGAATETAIDEFIEKMNEIKAKNFSDRTEIVGTHLEGPFLNPEKAGLIDPDKMIHPSTDLTQKWIENSADFLKIMTIAPELSGSLDVIKQLAAHQIIASCGHSNATKKEAEAGVEAGSTQFTHLFNGMRGIHHREPGLAGVGLMNDGVFAEMAGFDTHSIDPMIWKMIYRLKGPHHVILTTDANILKGLPDGYYEVGGEKVKYEDGYMYVEYQGAERHPGKPMTFIGTVKNTMKFTGATLADIVRMACVNPAQQIGIYANKGSLTPGKVADFVVLNENHDVLATYAYGNCVYQKQ